jgi:hypothetical protein
MRAVTSSMPPSVKQAAMEGNRLSTTMDCDSRTSFSMRPIASLVPRRS